MKSNKVNRSAAEAGFNRPPIQIILVGAGNHGFPAYVQDAFPPLIASGKIQVTGVIEPDSAALDRALKALGLSSSSGFADLKPALKQLSAEALVIASPYAAHEEACMLGIEHGLQLFIEKPVCGDLRACCRVAQAVQKAGRKAAVNMSARFEVEKQDFTTSIHRGVIGRVDYIFARLAWDHSSAARSRSRTPHPYLMEAGVHFLDLLRICAVGRPLRVHNLAWKTVESVYQGNANSVVSIEFDSGVRAVLEGSWASKATIGAWRDEYIRADGAKGSLLLDHRKLAYLYNDPQAPNQLITEPQPCRIKGPSGTATLFNEFVAWLRGERTDHPTELTDNLQTMALLFAANASAERHQVVDVQEFLGRNY